ncbi:MAG: hypothetical protein B0D92_03060 [Spirochaeta sp. LUC14_002_19_P3]|nr:MAG: hypothetical protein B0D92_03060 [Spirochaeta sp. LUC14_002_19_P3]
MRNFLFVAVLFILGGAAAVGDDLYLVSDIEVKGNGTEVVISWRDNTGLKYLRYHILRHYIPITEHNYKKAEVLAELPRRKKTYTDRPQGGREWWYAVMIVTSGKFHDKFLDWQNFYPFPVTANSPSYIEKVAKVSSILVRQTDSEILVEVTADKDDRDIAVFRSLQPIDSLDKLDYAKEIGRARGKVIRYKDVPTPQVPYIYAAVDAELFDTAYPYLLNFTKISPSITANYKVNSSQSSIRSSPLPKLRLPDELNAARSELPQRFPLSNDARRVITSILSTSDFNELGEEFQEEPKPMILPVDRGESLNQRQETLRGILEGPFTSGDWQSAETKLFSLLSSNGIEADIRSRVLFYRGQALYFLKRYEEAFLAFTVSSQDYYSESRQWILILYKNMDIGHL